MDLIVKQATQQDIPVIYSLADKIWREHYPNIISAGQIDYMLQSRYSPAVIEEGMQRGEKYFLAFLGDVPVAYASFELKERVYFLHKFYVEVNKHRGGIGTQFFDFLLNQMQPPHPIRLQVNRLNFKAINFYFKKGFVIEYTGDFEIGGGYYMNDFVMIRRPGPLTPEGGTTL